MGLRESDESLGVEPNQVVRRAGTQPIPYRIVVRGALRSDSFGPEGWSVRQEDGYCAITGDVIDQAQLIGVIEWLGDRGVELVSFGPVRSVTPPGGG